MACQGALKTCEDTFKEIGSQMTQISAPESTAKALAQKAVATIARVKGGVTVGLGAFFVIWDVVNIVKDGKKKSQGNTLQECAEELENHLENQGLPLANASALVVQPDGPARGDRHEAD